MKPYTHKQLWALIEEWRSNKGIEPIRFAYNACAADLEALIGSRSHEDNT